MLRRPQEPGAATLNRLGVTAARQEGVGAVAARGDRGRGQAHPRRAHPAEVDAYMPWRVRVRGHAQTGMGPAGYWIIPRGYGA
ncbi:hypothetical protein [Streptomyces sp. RKND-216]|uniref:hypothetical protein n=1 Tax=Streptomyces sp. RKND-216 TaxID=2562581 RepID=UPI0014477D08